jgi:DNA-binding IclR family transcriptional regulator
MKKSVDSPAYVMQSVDRAFQLLDLFGKRRRLRINEIVEYLDVSAATASRLVTMLQMHGYVVKDTKTRGYIIGPRLRTLALEAQDDYGLRAQVRPSLETLAAETGETAGFGVLQGATVVFLDCVEGPAPSHVLSRIGVLFPAHTVATGKALLAGMTTDELLMLYPRERLQRATRRSLHSRSQLIDELEAVRRGRLAVSNGESEDGVYTIAVSVTDALGRSRGALSIVAPTFRLTDSSLAAMKRVLTREAIELSASLL